jgi:hypothetical protein
LLLVWGWWWWLVWRFVGLKAFSDGQRLVIRWVNSWCQLKPEEMLLSTLTIRTRRDVITTYTSYPLSGAHVGTISCV